MTYLVLGLLIFLGAHSIRIVADGWRTRQLARVGEQGWKGLFSVVSLIGFVLLVWGYGQTRVAPIELWQPPLWTRHLAALLTLISFVLLAAAYVPGNRIKAALGHPMLAGTKVWAFAHLIANGRLADLLLFGAFLVWSIAGFIAARRRDRFAGTRYPAAGAARDALVVSVGVLAWVAFAFWGHLWLIGVAPFG
ncbi:MAG: NnrU family protein [Sterolibacteriaceae bacterium]|nr:NnrU family protein [Sterolibacteriaceae bacterium]MBK9087065.1 NnrU family protein [Sterolibacteriaceae bacterium]